MISSAAIQADEVAAQLVKARLDRRALVQYPGRQPATLEEAYRIQEAAIEMWDDHIAGWKIGLIAAELRPTLGAERLSGPIFSRAVYRAAPDRITTFPIFAGGFAAVEAEFVFRMGADAPSAKTSWTDADALDLVEAVHIGVETAGSPMALINVWGPTVVSSDFGNNFGVILGPEIADWRARMASIRATTSVNGNQVGEGAAASLPGGPVAGLRFLLGHLAARGRPLKRGQLVSSGALTGVHDILAGQDAIISFEGCGQIPCRAMAA